MVTAVRLISPWYARLESPSVKRSENLDSGQVPGASQYDYRNPGAESQITPTRLFEWEERGITILVLSQCCIQLIPHIPESQFALPEIGEVIASKHLPVISYRRWIESKIYRINSDLKCNF